MNNTRSSQQPSQSSQQQQSHPRDREQRGNSSDQQRGNNIDQQRGNNTDQRNSGDQRGNCDNAGFQRAGGRRGPLAGYRNNRTSNNYSESDHTNNSEDNLNNGDGGGGGGGGYGRLEDRRRPPTYPDVHQIFVGNVPPTLTDEDLKGVFQKYGNIVEVRINTGKGKPTGGQPNGKPMGNVPNFGFITFDDETSVSRCLGDKPITVNNDHRLNVEEKKTKSKMNETIGYGPRPMRPPMVS